MRRSEKEQPASAGLLAAAGLGVRLGRGPKGFLQLAGATLLERSATVLARMVDELVVAVPQGWLSRAEELLPDATVIVGGESRQESVFALLLATSAPLVLVHDVARPFLPAQVAERVLAAARTGGAASAVLPVADTLIDAGSGNHVDREKLRAVQTPQAFRRELLLQAHLAARECGRFATDDAGLVRAVGGTVELVEGSPWLMKLTGQGDLSLAAALAADWDRSGDGTG